MQDQKHIFDSFIIRHMIMQIERRKKVRGTFFSVKTIKRTNNKERTFNARLGVGKHTVGGSLAYDPEKKHLLSVWDRVAKGYRMIAMEGLQYLKVCGEVLVKDGKPTQRYFKYYPAAKVVKRLRNK